MRLWGYDSLRHRAELRRRQLAQEGAKKRTRELAGELRFHPMAYPAGLVTLIIIAALPVCVPRFDFVRGPDNATQFLESAWQVEATVVALAAALILFALQVLANSPRRGLTLTEFAHDSLLLTVIELGSLAVLVTGAVLLGWGHGAPGGWSGRLATVLLALPIFLIPILFRRTISALDPAGLEARRRRRVGRAIQQQVDGSVRVAVATTILRDWCSKNGVALNTVGPFTRSAGHRVVIANRTGRVVDIDLSRLGELAGERKRLSGVSAQVRLLVELEAWVNRSETLLEYPASLPAHFVEVAEKVIVLAQI